MACWMTSVDGQDNTLIVIADPYSITAAQGTSPTLTCKYAIPGTATGLGVKWFKYRQGVTQSLLWTAENIASLAPPYNRAGVGYTGYINGTTADFPDLLSSHSLTFLSVQLYDQGLYYCDVVYWGQDGSRQDAGSSYLITLAVVGNVFANYSFSLVANDYFHSEK